MMEKQALREEIKKKLAAQGREERWKRSRVIEEKLFSADAFKKAKTVCFFVSLDAEVDTHGMIDRALLEKKKVLVPLTDKTRQELRLYEIHDRSRDLKKGVLGISEPDPGLTREASFSEVECVVVPGLAFDKAQNRLGRGKGFYDKFLGKLDKNVQKIGICFSFQRVDSVPVSAHDVKMDKVLTD